MSDAFRTLRPISLRQWGHGTRPLPAAVETSVICPMPMLLDDSDIKLFLGARPRQPHYTLPLEQSGFDILRNALVVGGKLTVVSVDDHVFFETYWDVRNLNDATFFRLRQTNPPIALMRQVQPSARLDRAILLGNPMSGNYHHWVVNCLPRLRAAREYSDWPVLVQGPLSAFQRDALEAMGVKRIKLFDGGIWQVGELVIPANGVFAPSELRWVRDQLLRGFNIRPGKPRRLYFSRADAAVRRVTNETEVIECLKRHGFELLVLSTMPLRDQVQAFADAEIVTGPHGAGLTNIIFGDERQTLLELHPADQVNYCFWLTAGAMGQRYAFLSGKAVNTQRDMTIDIARLDQLVRRIIN
ncbi:MAG: glycosyltransferase family 61 protein [Acidobacteriota bacterium]